MARRVGYPSLDFVISPGRVIVYWLFLSQVFYSGFFVDILSSGFLRLSEIILYEGVPDFAKARSLS